MAARRPGGARRGAIAVRDGEGFFAAGRRPGAAAKRKAAQAIEKSARREIRDFAAAATP